jgi:hypothetical protein
MNFPITREALQTFDPIQEKKRRDDIYIQNHINALVQQICGEIKCRMEWVKDSQGSLIVILLK